ncbi:MULTISPECIES: hypothetical protein [unclassified Massilia]|uniref:hypothetical protein n=1 Tax=unclassified Massilia TaxID=2609279 RepID=UPI00177B81D2|nr:MULTISPECIES: hypothetical protein [unclassified Massilia]MBD8529008.1 hypothetical protein [Massilia sp. CFBP 13647]MBD8672402.1 hypothetical protein [Massilia sp. CFBP 13721]
MDLGEFRPILSGLIGGLVALGLTKLWARWIPTASGDKPAAWLLASYRGTLRIANLVLAAGLIGAGASYRIAGFANNDWRPLALGVGGGCTVALLVLALHPRLRHGNARDAFVAFAISSRTPASLLYGVMGCLTALLPLALFYFVT